MNGEGPESSSWLQGVEVNRKTVFKMLSDRLPKCTDFDRRGLKKSYFFRLHLQRLTSLEES